MAAGSAAVSGKRLPAITGRGFTHTTRLTRYYRRRGRLLLGGGRAFLLRVWHAVPLTNTTLNGSARTALFLCWYPNRPYISMQNGVQRGRHSPRPTIHILCTTSTLTTPDVKCKDRLVILCIPKQSLYFGPGRYSRTSCGTAFPA